MSTLEERVQALEALLIPVESTLAPGESGVLPPQTLGQQIEWLKGWANETCGDHEARLRALELPPSQPEGCQAKWHRFGITRFCPDCAAERPVAQQFKCGRCGNNTWIPLSAGHTTVTCPECVKKGL